MASPDRPWRERLERAVLNVFAALLIGLMAAIALQVLANLIDLNPLLRFSERLFWLGDAVTLNSLLDLQWHLLAVLAFLPAGLVWLRDAHVRVDFLYDRLPPGARDGINIAGNLIFAAPFLAMAVPGAQRFWQRAWRADEGSANGGLNDLWLIKAVLPLGLSLLALAALVETVRLLRRIAR
ncbi:MAG: TRAP transporter small permease subunit [Roseicyclus sp.]|jgi:TRAP-type mannitol/chloroaromatic compound transport system permease small subunit|nr:TRAP transporter small permease subunit [Roseicyclus sp.]